MESTNKSGRTQQGVPIEADDLQRQNGHVAKFIKDVLTGRKLDKLPKFVNLEVYRRRNSGIADGLACFGKAREIGRQGSRWVTQRGNGSQGSCRGLFRTISKGRFTGKGTSYYDLFRVEDGLIGEQ